MDAIVRSHLTTEYDKWASRYYRYIYLRRILFSKPISCDPQSHVELHSVVCKRDFLLLLWSIKSFAFYSKIKFHLVIHEDGSLNTHELRILKYHLKGCEVIEKHVADEQIRMCLRDFKNCASLRFGKKRHWQGIKLIDVYYFSREKFILLFDADVLFTNTPFEILEHISRKQPFFLDNAKKDSYVGGREFMKEHFDITMVGSLNSGMLYSPNCVIQNLAFIDSVLEELADRQNFDLWAEQTIMALLFSKYFKNYKPERLGADYSVFRKETGVTAGCHFTYNTGRGNFENVGLPILRKKKFLSKLMSLRQE